MELARYSDARVEALSKEIEAFKDKTAEEAKRSVAEAERRTAEAVAAFQQSATYKRDLADTTAYAYNLGFRDCKLKVRQIFNLEGVDNVEPDSVDDPTPSAPNENDTAPAEP